MAQLAHSKPQHTKRVLAIRHTRQNFQNFPPLYQRIRIGNIQYYRRRKLEYQTKLDRFIAQTRQNIIFGDWHDNGRLL